MESTMHPGVTAYTVTFELTAPDGHVTRTLPNTIVAPTAALARQLGERIAQAAASSLAYCGAPWSFDPDTVRVAELGDGEPAGTGPLLAAVEEELARSVYLQRILAALISRYGPLSLTAAEIDAVVPGAVSEVYNRGKMWLILPHQLGVPLSVAHLPELPDNGVVSATELHQHPGREVLVCADPDESGRCTQASSWQWRTILDVRPHPDGPAWLTLHTDEGSQTIVAAGTHSVRDPRPAPLTATGHDDG